MKKATKKSLPVCPRCGDASCRAPARRAYDPAFKVTREYRESLPDMMGPAGKIQGADVPIQQVGVSNFRLPLRFAAKGGGARELPSSVTGTVSLRAGVKGINMSRIVRTFYRFAERTFSPELLVRILRAYRKELGSEAARLKVRFSYPIRQAALRSGLAGWQFYECAFEGAVDAGGRERRVIHFDFVYSSACPCSDELSEHARHGRGIYSIPHSQRSKARVSVEIAAGCRLAIENLQKLCVAALRTETQVMVKREDEQAFAELNGAFSKFVEDAARLLHQQLDADRRIADFQVTCAHLESLHSHDAVAVITKGIAGGFRGDFSDFGALIC